MSAEIVLSSGHAFVVPTSDAEHVMQVLDAQLPQRNTTRGVTVASGFVDFESDDGIVFVRADQVVRVRDVEPGQGVPAAALRSDPTPRGYGGDDFG